MFQAVGNVNKQNAEQESHKITTWYQRYACMVVEIPAAWGLFRRAQVEHVDDASIYKSAIESIVPL
jgi:hypothetical protein